jgi:hypothetical protein
MEGKWFLRIESYKGHNMGDKKSEIHWTGQNKRGWIS